MGLYVSLILNSNWFHYKIQQIAPRDTVNKEVQMVYADTLPITDVRYVDT